MDRMETWDPELIARAQDGDSEAYRSIVERASPGLFRLTFRLTGNVQDAEDAVQDTLIKLHSRLDRFDGRASFGSWLYRVASNCAIDLLRAHKRRARMIQPVGEGVELEETAPATGPGPDRQAYGSELGRVVSQAMRQLLPRERAAFVLRHHEERPIKEIAACLGVTESAAKQLIFRAVRKLRSSLAPEKAAVATRAR
jgi:RNA polymerase sigma-70 factor (ECF subfamily)